MATKRRSTNALESKPRISRPARLRKRRPRRSRWLALLFAIPILVAVLTSGLWILADRTVVHPKAHAVWIEPYASRLELADRLQDDGVVEDPWLLVAYWSVFRPLAKVEIEDHFIADDLSLPELLDQLTRSSARPTVRITLPEGWTLFQMAERLEAKGICSARAFENAATSSVLMSDLGVPASSAEGYLFPDTYELYRNSKSAGLVRRLVLEGQRRFNAVIAKDSEAATRLQQKYGFRLHEIITLGSIIEKEAHDRTEQPTIASVFFNRLTDDTFLPRKMLQSDPTAAYGCLVDRDRSASCKVFRGQVTPEILRDAQNSYNTYRHPGLPPGPVSNPGISAVQAVLRPAETPFDFFVANGRGGHVFSRTLKEHETAIGGAK